MNNLRLRTRMGLVIAVLVLTSLAITVTGYVQLTALNARLRDMVDRTARADEECTQLRMDLMNTLRLERQTVISDSDDESRRYAQEARELDQRIAQHTQELGTLIDRNTGPEQYRHYGEFARYWRRFQAVHDQALSLGERNTGMHAEAALRDNVMPQADLVVQALVVVQQQNEDDVRAAVAADWRTP